MPNGLSRRTQVKAEVRSGSSVDGERVGSAAGVDCEGTGGVGEIRRFDGGTAHGERPAAIAERDGVRSARKVDDDITGRATVHDGNQTGVIHRAEAAHHDAAVVSAGVVIGDGSFTTSGDVEGAVVAGPRFECQAARGDGIAAAEVNRENIAAVGAVNRDAGRGGRRLARRGR